MQERNTVRKLESKREKKKRKKGVVDVGFERTV
jgi:hypothetical protein